MSDILTTATLPTVNVSAGSFKDASYLYDRYIIVEAVNRAGNITGQNRRGNNISTAEDRVVVNGDEEGFHIEFEWDKQLDHSDSSDTGSVTIYGLKEETANTLGGVFTTIKLSCGYRADQKPTSETVLFIGDVIDSKYEKEEGGTKLTMRITANATQLLIGRKVGYLWTNPTEPDFLKDKTAVVQYENLQPDNFVRQFLDYAIEGTQITSYSLDFSEDAKKVMRERLFLVNFTSSAVGTIKNILDEVFRPINISWRAVARGANHYDFTFFTKNELNVANPNNTAYVISSDTGLIGLPYLRSDTITRAIDQDTESNEVALNIKQSYGKDGTPREVKRYKVRRQGVGFKALIDTDIEPNSIVDISTAEGSTDGLYRVRNVKFKGSNFSQDWYMEVECEGRIESTTRRLSIPNPTATIE